MIFAEMASPTSEQLVGFLLSLGAVAWLVMTFLKIADHFKKKEGMPQPLITSQQPVFADKADTDEKFKQVHTVIDSKVGAVKENLDDFRGETRSRLTTITGKLSDISLDNANGIGELRGEIRNLRTNK